MSTGTALVRPITSNPAKRRIRLSGPRSQRARVDLVADHNRRYPGEVLIFFVRVQVYEALATSRLELLLPEGVQYRQFRLVRGPNQVTPQIRRLNEDMILSFQSDERAGAGSVYEYEIETLVEPAASDFILQTRAVFRGQAEADPDGDPVRDEERLAVQIAAQGDYLNYLPALFSRDEMMGRLLMLFESFWKPVDQQISQLHYIFDPAVTPADMLPWLASWLDLVLEPEWPEQYRRDLLTSARRLYAKRGTKVGLEEYLETYTGGDVQIIEHRADNFRLRSVAELGSGIALGQENHPHTFSVILRLPPDQLETEEDLARWQRVVSGIIDSEKPAHTAYSLQIEKSEASQE